MKKIFILLFIFTLFYSCGKKGDPVFKESRQNSIIHIFQNKKFS